MAEIAQIDGLERDAVSISNTTVEPPEAIAIVTIVSIALSLKRIADAMEGEPVWLQLSRIAKTLEKAEIGGWGA